MRDCLLHRPRPADRIGAAAPDIRRRLRLGVNPLPAVAEANDRLDRAGREGLDELAEIDPAVIAADDNGDVATGINLQRRYCRFGDRRNAVVDEEEVIVLAELLL